MDMLAQHLLFHRALDEAVRSVRDTVPIVRELIEDDMLPAGQIEDDLRYFEYDIESIVAEPGTARLVEHIERTARENPTAVFGLHYVREGAHNGNRFVSMKVRKTFGLPETGEGTRYLDPYGANQRKKWEGFKGRIDEFELTQAEQDAVFNGARSMFEYMINLSKPEHIPASQLLADAVEKGILDKAKFDADHAPGGHHGHGGGHGGHSHAN